MHSNQFLFTKLKWSDKNSVEHFLFVIYPKNMSCHEITIDNHHFTNKLIHAYTDGNYIVTTCSLQKIWTSHLKPKEDSQ